MKLFKQGLIAWVGFAMSTNAMAADDSLRDGFLAPPPSALPRVWWHWLDGNVSKDGIQRDLDWMHRVGIGGFQLFDASLMTPQVVEHKIDYLSPEWRDAIKFAAETADRLGLEMAIAGAPGWSESGGPWVTEPAAMKKLVWSSLVIEGGKRFDGRLPAPPANAGPYQNIPRPAFSALGAERPVGDYYRDSAVIAYPLPDNQPLQSDLAPRATGNQGQIDAALLSDGDLAHTVRLPYPADGSEAFILLDFGKPRGFDAMTLALEEPYPLPAGIFPPPAKVASLEASDDGIAFHPVTDVPGGELSVHSLSFPTVTARYFRLRLVTREKPFVPPVFAQPKTATDHGVGEFVLYSGPRVNRGEEKAAFELTPDASALPTVASSATAPGHAQIVDLTARMTAEGGLDWTPPPGRWVVLRMGYSPLGTQNHPANPTGMGLEVDKLSRAHVHDYLESYLAEYARALGTDLIGKRGLGFMVNDSWEAGAQNWTEEMIGEFSRRRGYSMVPYLPVLTGQVIDSPEASDRFLWDFRKTIGELTTDEHYGEITKTLHSHQMGHYAESHESGRAMIADGMAVKVSADIPMGAMWTKPRDQIELQADIRESASVAHLYGKAFVAAESMTSMAAPFSSSPETLKPDADLELASGLNRFVIHTSVHQPLADKGPGVSLGPFGQWFTRHETWGEMALPWTRYLARSAFLMQQGHPVADILWFYGEDTNVTQDYQKALPALPAGYDFDFANEAVLRDLLSVKDGALVAPSGARYQILALAPRNRTMTVAILEKLRALAESGAVIVGDKPVSSPSAADDPVKFAQLADALWNKGLIHPAASLGQVLAQRAEPDFQATGNILFVHRKLADGDLYFVDNRDTQAVHLDASFRVAGHKAQIWRADEGNITEASYRSEGGRTIVPLDLAPNDAVFVVFRGKNAPASRIVAKAETHQLATLTGPWTVTFQPDRGAPPSLKLEQLSSLSEQSDPAVRYFSGRAQYTASLTLADAPHPGRLFLDLGQVKNVAEVRVNGRAAGTAWHPPFRVEISGLVKQGVNRIEIDVANLWQNRLIGDHQPGAAPVAAATLNIYAPDTPLPQSGLIGPVTLWQGKP